jgi:hypothetical protein
MMHGTYNVKNNSEICCFFTRLSFYTYHTLSRNDIYYTENISLISGHCCCFVIRRFWFRYQGQKNWRMLVVDMFSYIRANSGIKLGHYRLLPSRFQFIINDHLNIWHQTSWRTETIIIKTIRTNRYITSFILLSFRKWRQFNYSGFVRLWVSSSWCFRRSLKLSFWKR